MIKKTKILSLIDIFIVFINISLTHTVIPFILFTPSASINALIIVVFDLLYLLFRFNGKLSYIKNDYLFYLFILISISNIVGGVLTNTIIVAFVPFTIANVLFYMILVKQYYVFIQNHNFLITMKTISRGYVYMVIACIFGALSLLFLMEVGNVNLHVNNISNTYNIFKDNIDKGFVLNYYYPFNLGIIAEEKFPRLPLFHDYGVICSFFHEPASMTFVMFPALFLLLTYYKKRILTYFSYALILLLAASIMNVFSITACLVCYVFIKSKKWIPLYFMIFIYIILMLIQLDNSLVELIKYKLFISGSGNYSLQTVLFAFTPSSILGTEMFDNSFIYSSDKTLNVGLVSFILNLFFLVIFIFKIVKLILHSNSNVKMLGFCVLYFFLHSSKYCMRSYSFTLLLFMVFILNVTYRNLNRDECFR